MNKQKAKIYFAFWAIFFPKKLSIYQKTFYFMQRLDKRKIQQKKHGFHKFFLALRQKKNLQTFRVFFALIF